MHYVLALSFLGPTVAVALLLLHLRNLVLASPFRLNRAALFAAAYLVVNALVFQLENLLQPEFYRYDGTLILVALMFALVPSATLRPDSLARLAFIGCGILGALHAILAPADQYLTLFYEGHNAAGGAISLLALFALYQNVDRRSLWQQVAIIAVAAALLHLTDSRQGQLALLVGIIAYHFRLPPWKLGLVLAVLSLAAGAYFLPDWIATGRYIPQNDESFDPNISLDFRRASTIIVRIGYYWPRAVDFFQASPILGVGLGSYNDGAITTGELQGVFARVLSNVPSFSADNPHNSYLALLSETGIIGFLAIGIFLFRAERFVQAEHLRAYRALLCSLLTLCMFEHRLNSPSSIFVFLGIYYSLTVASRPTPLERWKK